MDFYQIRDRTSKKDNREIYPEFKVIRSKDLMIRGKSFYAVWDQEKGMWSTNEYDVQRLVDRDVHRYRKSIASDDRISVKYMLDFSSGSWMTFQNYAKHIADNYHQLDEMLTFADQEVKKDDYVSKRLPYALTKGDFPAFDELVDTLYDPDERRKIEWSIGAIVSGDSREIQKFVVFYGDPGTGKGTVLKIIQRLFAGYCVNFNAKSLTGNSNTFATEIFRSNPLVAVEEDSDLSRIEDNTILNSIVSHEMMEMHEKFKPSYNAKLNCFLFLGTNKPVKITDAKSGVIRRLIDINPSMRTIPGGRYHKLMKQIDFELGAIAQHCLEVYQELGKHYYDKYRPINMMFKTDPFFNFVEYRYLDFLKDDSVSLKAAYASYKEYCDESGITKMPMHKFREELKNYFKNFEDQARVDGKQVRSWYSGFRKEKFDRDLAEKPEQTEEPLPSWLVFDKTKSLLDMALADYPAQYTKEGDIPSICWDKVKTRLKDLDTSKTHCVLVPKALVTIDFDLKNEKGEKDQRMNLQAAALWPKTYGEYSKGGAGVHLEYYYTGDTSALSSSYSPGIEVKVLPGHASLRRRVSFCNDVPIATISSGLPVKEKKVIDFAAVRSERALRDLIERNLRKEIHPGTKPSIDFIEKILSDAYDQGLKYDVTDLRPRILNFANHSSHQAPYCITKVSKMKFSSTEPSAGSQDYPDDRMVFFDVEVFPNLVLVNWKYAGDTVCQRMINPSSSDIEPILKMKLVGFNCRRYDNHILYAIFIGKTIPEIYDLSYKIVNGSKNAMFGEAYNLSYTDVYDFCSKKQSLKKWEIELGFHHQELGLPWDQPVPEEKWMQVAEYCDNDVFATEAVFNNRQADWTARQILADIAGMTVNDTTNSLTTRIIFGTNRNPQSSFNYRDMGDISKIADKEINTDPFTAFDENNRPIFPGYKYDSGISTYRGEEVGEGGYVYAEPGIHRNVALLDIASMHPSSIVAEQLFGPIYTGRFSDILQARIFIKHKDFESAKKLFDGRLAGYLDDPDQAKALAGALKIAINSVYGLTSAKFDNPFRDIRNVDNIVAKRGALFMVNLKHQVQKKGFTVAHIKTDSIKIPNATPEIIQFVTDYGKLYGYNFEHEATYDRMCLVNDAVYIAKYSDDERNEHPGEWTATGTQFQVPYVFKTLFSKEPIDFDDLCETKTVTSALYLDMNEGLPDVKADEKELAKLNKQKDLPAEDALELERVLKEKIAAGHNYIFIGKAGLFCPILPGYGGGLLMREKDGKYYAATGTKGYRWKEAETVKILHQEDSIDRGYFDELAEDAKKAIEEYGSFDSFIEDPSIDEQPKPADDLPPWYPPCGDGKYKTCYDCPHFHHSDSVEGIAGVVGCDLDYEIEELYLTSDLYYEKEIKGA